MDVTYPPEAEKFRSRIRAFLHKELAADWTGLGSLSLQEQAEFRRSWRSTLGSIGLLAVSWPREYGGPGLTQLEQVVLSEEFAAAGVPEGTENDTFGIQMLGNTLIAEGTEAQKLEFLPRILDGSHVWCQGYSEPDAGSDLAALRTRAEKDGDEWVLNGQKIWTSSAHEANWIFVLARSDSEASPHRGISFLLVPMDQEGVEVRPIKNAAGYGVFSEVFFTDARTSVENVVGEVNGGWRIAMTLLGHERGGAVTTDPIRFRGDLERLIALAKDRDMLGQEWLRDEFARCFRRLEIMRARSYIVLSDLLSGVEASPANNAISKVLWTEHFQHYAQLSIAVLGAEVLAPVGGGNNGDLIVPSPGTPNSSRAWVETWIHSRASTIYAGTSEIQRNIISERLLGLPR